MFSVQHSIIEVGFCFFLFSYIVLILKMILSYFVSVSCVKHGASRLLLKDLQIATDNVFVGCSELIFCLAIGKSLLGTQCHSGGYLSILIAQTLVGRHTTDIIKALIAYAVLRKQALEGVALSLLHGFRGAHRHVFKRFQALRPCLYLFHLLKVLPFQKKV